MTDTKHYERPEVSVLSFESEGVLASSTSSQLDDLIIEEEMW